MHLRSCLIKLLAADRAEDAILLLESHLNGGSFPEVLSTLTLLSARINRLKVARGDGIVSKHESEVEINRINAGFNQLIQTLPETLAEIPVDCQYTVAKRVDWRLFLSSIVLLIALALLIMPWKGFDASLYVLTDRLSFQVEGGDDLCLSLPLKAVTVQNFIRAEIPAESFSIEAHDNSMYAEAIRSENRLLVLRPKVSDLEPTLMLDSVTFECIKGGRNSTVTLTNRREEENLLQFELQHTTSTFEITMQGSTKFSSMNTSLAGGKYFSEEPAIFGWIHNSTVEKALIIADSLSSIVMFNDSINTVVQGFEVSHVNFLKPTQGVYPISSIIKASINVLGRPVRQVGLGEDLFLHPSTPLHMKSISINSQGILVCLEGQFDEIKIGAKGVRVNPRGYELFWANYPSLLFGILGIMLLVVLWLGVRSQSLKK